jgi:hypothetical protein
MVAEWWDGVELWVSGLPFAFQFALVIVLLGPLCVVVAWAIDRVVDHASTWFGPAPGDEAPIGAEPPDAGADERTDGSTDDSEDTTEDLVESTSR